MKNAFKLLLVALGFMACTRKNPSQKKQAYADSVQKQKIYSAQTTAFIERFINQKPINLSDKVDSDDFASCFEQLKQDTLTFTKKEIAFILSEHKHPLIKKWTKQLIPSANLIDGNTITEIFSKDHKGWKYFYKHIGKEFNSFSAPIFLRNNQYCIFYSSLACGDRCGEGQLILYKKEGANWKEVKVYCDWIS